MPLFKDKIKYKLKQVKPGVYLATFKKGYDLAMTFLRCQEYYESTKFRGRFFKLTDYMHWYATTQSPTKDFSYTRDFNGFNVPGWVVKAVVNHMVEYDAHELSTNHDDVMLKIYHKLSQKHSAQFYLIGVSEETDLDGGVLAHETAHGLYATNKEYRDEMMHLVRSLPKNVHRRLCKRLTELTYHKAVHTDEIHAYMSTGLRKSMLKIPNIKKYAKQFEKVFKRYMEKK